MAQRYGTLAKRLQDAFARGILKARIDAAERGVAVRGPSKTLVQELDGFLPGGAAPASTSGRGIGRACVGDSRFPGRLESMDARLFSFTGVPGRTPELNCYFGRSWNGVLIPSRVGESKFAAPAGRAALCSEARASTVADAVHGQGTRGSPVARNSMRWTQQAGEEKSQSMLMYLLAMVVAVVGMTYASVPLYRRFCQATGYGGTVQRRETVEEKIAKQGREDTPASRELVVHFNADIADSMPWKFTPCQRQVKVKVGQSTLAFYTAENTSSEVITGVSTYNVAPMQAGAYFTKIQCFCFEEQRLRPGEKIDMPVLFYIDPEFSSDPKMDSINSLILSYTFFKVEEEEEDQ